VKGHHHSPVYYNPYPYYGYNYDPYLYDRLDRYRTRPEPQQPQIVVIKDDDKDDDSGWMGSLQIPTILATLLISFLIWGRGAR